ncbi:MAG: hypothetical protein EXS16_07540 [Gemmataceae bacterium]|nr:hypothetical protein [Gemmataceae bacterium]
MSTMAELSVFIVTLLGLICGGWCIYWVKMIPCVRRARLGRWLFVLTLLTLGAMALVAAVVHADSLAPLGLLSGFLVIGMLWENPHTDEVPSERTV